jgi:hypothetical protein
LSAKKLPNLGESSADVRAQFFDSDFYLIALVIKTQRQQKKTWMREMFFIILFKTDSVNNHFKAFV